MIPKKLLFSKYIWFITQYIQISQSPLHIPTKEKEKEKKKKKEKRKKKTKGITYWNEECHLANCWGKIDSTLTFLPKSKVKWFLV